MKKNKKLIITVILCLLPMIAGVILYNKLPENMPIHFNFHNEVDRYGSKNFVLFGLPVIMAILQVICIFGGNYRANKSNLEKPKVVKIFEWVIPILTILLYTMTLEVALENDVNIGRLVCLFTGIMFILIGNYMPKMSYEAGGIIFHPTPKTEKGFRKVSKIFGYSFIGVGIVVLILVFFV